MIQLVTCCVPSPSFFVHNGQPFSKDFSSSPISFILPLSLQTNLIIYEYVSKSGIERESSPGSISYTNIKTGREIQTKPLIDPYTIKYCPRFYILSNLVKLYCKMSFATRQDIIILMKLSPRNFSLKETAESSQCSFPLS